MLSITRFIIWKQRFSILIWSLSLGVINILMGFIFDIFSDETEAASALYESFSELEAFFPIEDILTPAGFLNVELYSFVYPICIVILAVGIGSRLVGKEEQTGTLEFLLSQPITRGNIYMQKAAAIELKLFIVSFAVFLSLWFATILVPAFDIGLESLASVNLGLFFFGLIFGMFAYMLTGLGFNQKTAANASIALFIFSYLINIIPEFVNNINWLQQLSFFHYFDTTSLLSDGFQWGNMILLMIIAVVLYGGGYYRFVRRDIAV